MQNLQRAKQVVLISPITKTSTTTATADLDCKGHRSVDITVMIGTAKNTNGVPPKTIKLSESDDTVSSNFADISGATHNAALAASTSVRFHVDLRKRKRYIKLTFTPETTTNDDQLVSAIAVLDRSNADPSSTSGFGNEAVKII